MRTRSRLLLAASSLTLFCAIAALAAGSAFGYAHINSFYVTPSTTQAGGHPDVDIVQTFDNRQTNEGGAPPSENPACECQDVFEIKNLFPPGFIGNPHVVPRCTLLAFSHHNCAVESQVGVAGVIIGQQPIFNMEPHPGEPGLLAFYAPLLEFPVFIELAARTDSDYGLNGRTTGIYHPIPLSKVELHFWGVPGSPAHDANRFPAPQTGFCVNKYPEPCTGAPATPFEGAVAPFLENPTSCGTPLTMGLDLVYYDFTALHADTPWPATTGCDLLSFNPTLTAKPTTTEADTPTGLDVDLLVPQTQSGGTPSPSEIKSSKVTLPSGFSINPNAADGKTICTDQQAAFGTLDEAKCPEHAKIGTVSIDSSALPAPIDGGIYLGEPQPGNRYRIIVTGDGFSTHVKLAGSVKADPETGQLVTSFVDLPQSPLQEFSLHFFGSERGFLATPTKCGSYPVETEFVPWDTALPNQTSTAFFTIDSGPNEKPCPGTSRSFNPQVGAGSPDNTAGAHSPFALKIERADGDQNLSGLQVTTPPGFSATLKGIPYCPESSIAQLADTSYSGLLEQTVPICPAASQIGTATGGVGAGSHPFYAPGKTYLAGPYKGSPLSLVVVIPAVSGPYDLGNVAVRAAIHVDPATAQVTTVADPFPSIVEGIPLRARSLLVNLDRPEFTLNPTNCSRYEVRSQIFGSEGGSADLLSHFQAANCGLLPYDPKLSIRLSGGLNRLGHPAIHAELTAAPGEANSSSVTTLLPKGELLDNSHVGSVCTKPNFAADSCPAGSLVGHATVETPLLDRPVSGNIYLRSSRSGLPDLALDLEGQIDIEAVGRVDSVNGRYRATFATIPDVPFSRITFDLLGGKKGLLQNSESLCGAPRRATVSMVGQNGVVATRKIPVGTACGSAKHKRHRKSHVHRRRKGA